MTISKEPVFDALDNLVRDNYERSYSGSKNRDADAGLVRSTIDQQAARIADLERTLSEQLEGSFTAPPGYVMLPREALPAQITGTERCTSDGGECAAGGQCDACGAAQQPAVPAPGAVRELISGVRSLNRARHHLVHVEGEDPPCYYQRGEWIEWVLELADRAEQAIAQQPAVPEGSNPIECPYPCGWLKLHSIATKFAAFITRELVDPDATLDEELRSRIVLLNRYLLDVLRTVLAAAPQSDGGDA